MSSELATGLNAMREKLPCCWVESVRRVQRSGAWFAAIVSSGAGWGKFAHRCSGGEGAPILRNFRSGAIWPTSHEVHMAKPAKPQHQERSVSASTAAKGTAAKKAVAKKTVKKAAASKAVPTKKASPVKKPVAKKATSAAKAAPVKKAAVAKKATPVKRATPVKKVVAKKVVAKTTTVARSGAPAKKAAPVKKAVPVKKAASDGVAVAKKAVAKASAPAKKVVVAERVEEAAVVPVVKPSLRSIEMKAPPRPPMRPKKPIPSPVNAKLAERLRAQLYEERERHLRAAEELQAEADTLALEREPGDTQFDEESGEGDTLTVERERDLALSASNRQVVDEIDEALRRMDEGTYGVCATCGDKIALARLEVLPYAQLCIACKSRGERRR